MYNNTIKENFYIGNGVISFMERELFAKLEKWKNKKKRKPLIIQGARQVGKT